MKYRVGDKVRINNKDGVYSELGQVATVVSVDRSEYYAYRLRGLGSRYCEKELDLVKGENVNTRRTFRLLKDTPEVGKGALVQEACDDGNQEYVLLDGEFLSDATDSDYHDYFDSLPNFSRNTVEDQPDWFEEVEMHWLAKVARKVKKNSKKGKK